MKELGEIVGRGIVVPLEQGKQFLFTGAELGEEALATTMLGYDLI